MNTATLPLVSIILPTYNRLTLLKESLGCAQAQTYPNIEIIILDNASTDGTHEWLKQQAQLDPRLKLITNPYNMRGETIFQVPKHAKGQYLLILCDDDLIAPTLVEKAVEDLESLPALSFWFVRTEVFSIDKENQRHVHRKTPAHTPSFMQGQEFIKLTFARKLPVYWCSIVYRTEVLLRVGAFKKDLRFLDMANNIKCALQGPVFAYPEVLAYYRENPFTDTSNIYGKPLDLLPHYEAMYQEIRQYSGTQFDTPYLAFAICCTQGHILSVRQLLSTYPKMLKLLISQDYNKMTVLFLLLFNTARTLLRLVFR